MGHIQNSTLQNIGVTPFSSIRSRSSNKSYMKVVGYVVMCQLALGLALEDSRAVEKQEIDCPDIFEPDCTGLLECNLPKDQYGCPTGTYCIPTTITVDQTTCENKCPRDDCGANQLYCVGGIDLDDGCPLEDYCLNELADNGHPQECDEACEFGETKCPRIYDANGTPLPRQCVMLADDCPKDVNGVVYDEYGCVVHDAPNCGADGRICDSNFCSEYCKEKDTCALVVEQGCPAVCLQGGCQIYEVQCPRTFDNVGCPKDFECASHPSQCPKTEFEQNTGCPTFVDPECDEDTQFLCASGKKSLQELYATYFPLQQVPAEANANQVCEDKKVCVDKTSRSGRNEVCEISQCPDANCPEGETLCDMGYEKGTGCKLPDQCMNSCPGAESTEYDNRGCEVFEEVVCDPTEEKTCEGITDSIGCVEMATCLPQDDRCKCPVNIYNSKGCRLDLTKENEPEDLVCGDNMHKCFMGWSEETQCPVGYQCLRIVPEGKDHCTQECPPECDIETLRSCPNADDVHGCPRANSCQARTYTNDRADTLKGSVECERYCDPVCDNPCAVTYDSNGCKEPVQCAPQDQCPVSHFDDQGCAVFVNECNQGEQQCPGGFDEDNCPKTPVCIPADKQCPPECQFDEKMCALGSMALPGRDLIDFGQICIDKMISGGVYNEGQCENPCPPACEMFTQRVVFGGYDPNTGCKQQDICIEKATPYHETIDAIGTCSDAPQPTEPPTQPPTPGPTEPPTAPPPPSR